MEEWLVIFYHCVDLCFDLLSAAVVCLNPFSDIVTCVVEKDYRHNFTIASRVNRLETDVEIAHSDGFCWIDYLDSTLLPVWIVNLG